MTWSFTDVVSSWFLGTKARYFLALSDLCAKGLPDQREAIRAEEEARKRNLLRRFVQEFKVSTEEAFWYLDEHNYNYVVAAETRAGDLEWEKSNPGSKKVGSTLV